MKIEERNEKSNSIRWQENLASSVFFGVLYAVVARLIVDALRPWKSGNKRYLSLTMISRNRDFLLTCVTKFSSVSIWTNTGEAIYSIFTGTAVVASNTDTIIDVWKQPHKTLAQLKKLGWVRNTLVNDVNARHHLDVKQSWRWPTRL